MLTKPTGRLGSASRVGGEQRLEVGERLLGVRLGFVGDAPQHDARVVLVAGDEFERSPGGAPPGWRRSASRRRTSCTCRPGRSRRPCRGSGRPRPSRRSPRCRGGRPGRGSPRRTGSARCGTSSHRSSASSAKSWIIEALSWPLPRARWSSCMPKPRKWNGSPLIRNRVPVDAHAADADRLEVAVDHVVAVEQFHGQFVEVPVPGRPQLGVVDAQFARRAAAPRPPPCRRRRAARPARRRHRPVSVDAVLHHARRPVDVGDDRDVVDVVDRRRATATRCGAGRRS